jgi:hypothetical protein
MADNMTVQQIRELLTYLEENYSLAYDGGAYGLADAFRDKINAVWKTLLLKIQAEDPYTTEADVRYFEGA